MEDKPHHQQAELLECKNGATHFYPEEPQRRRISLKMVKTFDRIYTVVSSIPKGKVATYGQIAKALGLKNPRVVGFAMHTNKDTQKIPCHRVVGKNGILTGYARGGITIKKKLLEAEGIKFIDDQRVDLANFGHANF